jgi:SAM-dependent methyltransferase
MRCSEHELLACPRCAGELRRLRCGSCGVQYAAPGGIPDLRLPADARTEAVREFYARAPFPGYPPRDSLLALRDRARRSEFARGLDQAIPGDARVLEVGCGTGVFLQAAADRGAAVYGLDASEALLELARERVPEADLCLGDLEALPYEDDLVGALREAGRSRSPRRRS